MASKMQFAISLASLWFPLGYIHIHKTNQHVGGDNEDQKTEQPFQRCLIPDSFVLGLVRLRLACCAIRSVPFRKAKEIVNFIH